jgi:hypothetical protein
LLCAQIDKATLDKASAAALGESSSSSTSSSSSDSDSGSAGDSTKPRKSVGDLSDAELKGKKVKRQSPQLLLQSLFQLLHLYLLVHTA